MSTVSRKQASRRTRLPGKARSALAISIAVVLGQGVISGAASAQEAGSTNAVLEEIIVTAERRDVSLQNVPTSASVLTANMIASQGINNILDVQRAAPSVAINTYNRSTFINIRGVGIAQSAPTSNPGVAFYIDGVYIPHEHFIAQSFYDLEAIEVLRGPQGTLTGQNSTGGAVYVRSPAPQLDEFSGYIDQTFGDYGWSRTIGATNLALGSKAAMRIAAVYETRDSFTDNIGPSPSEPGSGDTTGVRLSFRLEPTDAMTLDLRYEYFDRQTDYNAVKNRNDLVTSDPFVIQEDARSFLNQDGYRAALEARFDMTDNLQFRVLTSYLDGDNEDQADGDRTDTALPVPPNLPPTGANTALFPGRVGLTFQSFQTSVTEINLLNTDDGPLQWVVGAFYMDETTPVQVLRDNRNTTDFVQSNSDIIAEAENRSASVFGQVDYGINDSWEVGIGLRYSDDKQDYTRFALPGPPPPGCFPCTNTAESTETTGRLSLKYFLDSDTMLYSSLSRGYKAGGVNLDPRLDVFGPETNQVLELGMKSTLADSRLRVNGAVFYSDYAGIQLSALTAPPGGGPLLPNTLNAGDSKIYGAEIELEGRFDALGFNFGVGLLQGEFDEDVILTDSQTNTNTLVPKGTPLPFTPEITASAGIQYDFAVGRATVTPRLQAAYKDKQFATPFEYEATTVPSRTIADFRLTIVPNDNLQLEAFISNLFDETYIATQLQDASSATGGMLFGPPRQYGARIKYDF